MGEYHTDIARIYNNIGFFHVNLCNYEKALDAHQQSLKIKQRILDNSHPEVVDSYNNIAGVYNNLQNYAQATNYFQKSVEIQCKIDKKYHPDIVFALDWLNIVIEPLKDFGSHDNDKSVGRQILLLKSRISPLE